MARRKVAGQYWPIEDHSIIDELFLDQKNIRIPITNATQAALIQDLFSNEDALDLVKSFAQNGIFPDEFPIAVKEKGKLVVIEGNRRLAALKALNQPDIVPAFKERITNFRNPNIKTIKVVIAPSRESSVKHLANKHTINYKRSWKPLRQAYFYQSQLENGKTIDELRDTYPEHDIPKFVRMLEMHLLAKAIDFGDDIIMEKIRDERRFPITNLERMYENPTVQETFGFSFDKNGRIRGKIQKTEFDKGFNKLVEDISRGVIDSRKTNNSKQIQKYLNDLPEELKPDISKKGTFSARKITEVKFKGDQKEKVRSLKIPIGLFIPSHLPITIKSAALKAIYEELRDINVTKFPNATHDLLRSFLECTLIAFFKDVGEYEAIKRTDQHNPKLGEMLTHIINGKSAFIKDANMIDVLKQVKAHYDSPYSLERLNMVNHNENWNSTEKDVRAAWSKIENLFKIILNPPKNASNSGKTK